MSVRGLVVELMAHNPAKRFEIDNRGFIREGFKADITIVQPTEAWVVSNEIVESKCKWTPMAGETFHWRVLHTFCNGQHLLDNGVVNTEIRGEQITFRKKK